MIYFVDLSKTTLITAVGKKISLNKAVEVPFLQGHLHLLRKFLKLSYETKRVNKVFFLHLLCFHHIFLNTYYFFHCDHYYLYVSPKEILFITFWILLAMNLIIFSYSSWTSLVILMMDFYIKNCYFKIYSTILQKKCVNSCFNLLIEFDVLKSLCSCGCWLEPRLPAMRWNIDHHFRE